ncbi:hypothetical protein FF38_10020 [Lucilia cuprina]|uniref:Uncharacterized protein n=1 Tax=Lucilia cuprina TaxID=7375 RepID=A0A0L0C2M8_LUCCU|nr:Leucine-rich repeat-containing protein 34 [Lucilia cuprina]KNC26580.1 hypothetical protein FF38_10020 [Lucilia cuprina]
MCDYPYSKPIIEKKFRPLTLLLLDCWQREYDKRPYRNFKFERIQFEERLERNYDSKQDFTTIVLFLKKRSLYSIKLVGLTLHQQPVRIIYDFVEALQKLKRIELKLMELPLEFFQILDYNAELMKLKELSLEGTALTDKDILCLHSFIFKSKTLQILNISSCSINQYNFALLADAIYKSPTLNSCNMSHLLGLHLTLDSQKIAHIIASLIWQNKLQELILENCGLLGHDMEILAEYLYDISSKLQSLNVSFNKIGSNGALELFKAISKSKTLKQLKMTGCSLGSDGGKIVSQYLSSCWNLESLALQYNTMAAEVINMILLCMKKPCKLKKLYLYGGNRFKTRTGDILRRLLESGVLPQDYIDITVTFDDTLPGYRVIPWLP